MLSIVIACSFLYHSFRATGAVGVKDCRIDTIFHPGLRSTILHPIILYYTRNGDEPPNFHRCDWNFLPPYHTMIVVSPSGFRKDDESI